MGSGPDQDEDPQPKGNGVVLYLVRLSDANNNSPHYETHIPRPRAEPPRLNHLLRQNLPQTLSRDLFFLSFLENSNSTGDFQLPGVSRLRQPSVRVTQFEAIRRQLFFASNSTSNSEANTSRASVTSSVEESADVLQNTSTRTTRHGHLQRIHEVVKKTADPSGNESPVDSMASSYLDELQKSTPELTHYSDGSSDDSNEAIPDLPFDGINGITLTLSKLTDDS